MPKFLWITSLGLGYLRPAPGTWGSALTILIALVLVAMGLGPEASPGLFSLAMLTLLVFFTLACLLQGDAAEAKFLRKDPSQVTADETAGQCVPLLLLPLASVTTPGRMFFTFALAFVAFRLLDIVKPWPADRLQRIPGGWGIVLDDLIAGVYAAAIVQFSARWMLN
jgi:phosphatidylglycerophosphatase A